MEYEHWVEEVKAVKSARSTNTVHVSEHRELTCGAKGKQKRNDEKTAMKLSKDYPAPPETGQTKGHELRKAAARDLLDAFEVEYLITHKMVFTEVYHRKHNLK